MTFANSVSGGSGVTDLFDTTMELTTHLAREQMQRATFWLTQIANGTALKLSCRGEDRGSLRSNSVAIRRRRGQSA
jgi:hypothetical protein